MKRIIYYQILVLAVMFTSLAWSQNESEITDKQKNNIKTEVEGIINKKYSGQLLPLKFESNQTNYSIDAERIVDMYIHKIIYPEAEKNFEKKYSRFSGCEASVDDLKTEVLSSNMAYSTFKLNLNYYYKDDNSIDSYKTWCTFIFSLDDNKWKIMHEHLSVAKW
jgi:hypothetical protein